MYTDALPPPLAPEVARSLLWTDQYKPVMQLAGFPLRPETFQFMMRKNGPWYIPMDLGPLIRAACPDPIEDDYEYLASNGLIMGSDYRAAMRGSLTVNAVPAGCLVGNRETIFTVSGPSALASHIEGAVIGGIQFRIQVGTLLYQAQLPHHRVQWSEVQERLGVATCAQERDIILEVADAMRIKLPFGVEIDGPSYYKHVLVRATALLQIVEGDATRISEGGLRSATCPQSHDICVRACADAGIKATSNIFLARRYGLKPTGTTGHEHTQRWGNDYNAYAAVCDRLPFETTCLLDTYSTRHSGIPSAIRLMLERPDRTLSSRPDSEPTQEGDFAMMAVAMREAGITGNPINLSGGFNLLRTSRFEKLRQFYGLEPNQVRYLYGEFLQKPHVALPTRGDVGAVYKVSQTGDRATMKFSDNPAKASDPGRPVLLRLQSYGGTGRAQMPIGLTGQEGESVLDYGPPVRDASAQLWDRLSDSKPTPSPGTAALVKECETRRLQNIQNAVTGVL